MKELPMTIPDRVTSGWIATLANDRLVSVESRLHSEFVTEDTHERKRRGDNYALLQGPAALVNAWLRWQMVSNEARSRGLVVRHLM
jgi:hypothetical protein